jgi:hypothetical protein
MAPGTSPFRELLQLKLIDAASVVLVAEHGNELLG